MKSIQPPIADVQPKKLVKHGHTRIDNYFWLKDREDKKVVDYITTENDYVDKVMVSTKDLQTKLVAEFRARVKEDDSSAPYKKGNYYYLTKFEKGNEYPIYLRRSGSPTAADEVLLNVNELAKTHKYYDIGKVAASYDQNRLVYAADTVGRRFYNLYFKNLNNKNAIADEITNTTGNVIWLNDGNTILYTKQDPETLRSYQVYKYSLGGKSELVYEEKDPEYYVSVSKDLTQKTVYIYSISNSATEVRTTSADDTNANFKIFIKRETKHEYSVFDGGDRFFILTNHRAKNFKLVEAMKGKHDRKHWLTIVSPRENTLIEDVLVLKNSIVLQERKNGLTQLTHFARGKKSRKSLEFPDPTYVTSLGANAEYDATQFRYDYQSLTRPGGVYDFDFKNNKSTLVKSDDVPTYNAEEYKSERIFAKGKGGSKIPISIVYKTALFKKGTNPLYVYAYGSYGLSTDTYFRSNVISLLDRGYVFAIAHIRGGSEMGRHWYEDGKKLNKKNTFEDFIASTEFLLKNKYGNKNSVYAMGGSAGGLLMGAVYNMRPDLYKGIIAAVPFVDVVTTMLDDTIPLTTNEYEEWGNPNDKKFYKYILSYSPYDNVKKQKYTNLLITTGFHDSQVQYWEPAKWIAKLRAHNTNTENIMLMKTEMAAGHSGTTGRFESLKEDALEYAFFLMLEGLQ